MIDARFDRVSLSLVMRGHADHGRTPEGYDLVCCAASVLMYTLAYNAENSKLVDSVDTHFEPGDAFVTVCASDGCHDRVLEKIEVILGGLEMLEKRYPECIRFRYVT